MKKILYSIILSITILISFGFNFNIAEAQITQPEDVKPDWYDQWINEGERRPLTDLEQQELNIYKQTIEDYRRYADENSDKGESWWLEGVKATIADITGGVLGAFLVIVGALFEFLLVPIMAFLLTISGNLLDWALSFSVNTENLGPLLPTIELIWSIIRDVVNIFFIFALLYLSIRIIIQLPGPDAKRLLKNIIIAALLINFSLTITKAVIDASNIVSSGLYQNIINTSYVKKSNGTRGGLSDQFMQALHLQRNYAANITEVGNNAQYFIMAAVRFITIAIAAWAFFSAALLFIIRIVAFVLLLCFSPFAYVGYILPQTEKYAKLWWDTFIGQLIVAPIFLLFMIVITRIMQTQVFEVMKPIGTGATVNVKLYFNYIIVILLLLAAIKYSKQFSGEFGANITDWGKKAMGYTAAGLTGGAAILGRNVLGKRASRILDNEEKVKELQNTAAQGGVKGNIARLRLQGLEAASKSSYDIRASKGVGKFIKDQTGISIGTAGGKGGYAGKIDAKIKSEKKFADSLKSSTDQEKERAQSIKDEIKDEVLLNEDEALFNERRTFEQSMATFTQNEQNLKAEKDRITKSAPDSPRLTGIENELKQIENEKKNISNKLEQSKKQIESARVKEYERILQSKDKATRMAIAAGDRKEAYAQSVENRGSISRKITKGKASGFARSAEENKKIAAKIRENKKKSKKKLIEDLAGELGLEEETPSNVIPMTNPDQQASA